MEELEILWLDDLRNPEDYLYRRAPKSPSGAFIRNREFYDKLNSEYSLKFTWVRNMEEFKNYILSNGLPDFVSFDHDLGKGLSKGSECAQWLRAYCEENGYKMPRWFAHSANNNGRKAIEDILSERKKSKKIYLSESQFKRYITYLSEAVYINSINNKNKKANITYQQGVNRSKGNKNYLDTLKTDKMDNTGSDDTYEVTLKGGIVSYNITSIRGEDIMHYFKNKFKGEKTYSKMGGEDYELTMEDKEFNDFLNIFISKVSTVINHYLSKLPKNIKFSGISIYPVKSTSNFNIQMCKEIVGKAICGLPITPISTELFQKNLENLERDEDFIKKNQEYYNGKMNNVGDNASINQYIDRDINKARALQIVDKYIEAINNECSSLLNCLAVYNVKNGVVGDLAIRRMVKHYRMYSDLIDELKNKCTYYNSVKGVDSYMQEDSIFKRLKYTKGPSVEKRSEFLWSIVGSRLRGIKSPITGNPYKMVELVKIERTPFEIKNLTNAERMALRNIYSVNKDVEFVKQEMEKTKGTVFVIFDDNISGGATLGDICYNAKKLGIEYIIPITFGVMAEKWQMNMIPINKPINDKGEVGKFNF